jgi:hypothetical protein
MAKYRVRIVADYFTVDESVRRAWADVEDGWAIELPDASDPPGGLTVTKEYSDIEATDVKDAMNKAFETLYDQALASGVSGPSRLVVTAEPMPARS